MFRSILVPLDGGTYGERVLPLARELGLRFGATLHLVHVHADLAFASAMESLAFLGPPLESTSSAEEMAYLEALADRLTAEGISVETEVLLGSRDEALEEYAQAHADLIVACTHAHDGLSRIWHRSLGERMVRDLGIPTLLLRVPSQAEAQPEAGAPEFRHVLVPLSGRPEAEEALLSVVPLARACGASITLLHVVKPLLVVGYTLLGQNAHVNDFALDDQVRRAEAYLSSVAERLRAVGLRVETRVVTATEPFRAIETVIRTRRPGSPPISMVAMTTARHPFPRAMTSSLSDSLLHVSTVPVLLHRSGSSEAADVSGSAGVGRTAAG
jgi:nucleotide-binding universal stress UspA family protein